MARFIFAIFLCVAMWWFAWRGWHGLTFFPWWAFLGFALYISWRLVLAVLVGIRRGVRAMLDAV